MTTQLTTAAVSIDPNPRADPYAKTLSIRYRGASREACPRERAYLKARYTVFLGRVVGAFGGFDYWGCPATGHTISVGVGECSSSHFGPAHHWQAHRRNDWVQTTAAGRAWPHPVDD